MRSLPEIVAAVEQAAGIDSDQILEFAVDGLNRRAAREVLCYVAKLEAKISFDEIAGEFALSRVKVIKAFNRCAIRLAQGDAAVVDLLGKAAPWLAWRRISGEGSQEERAQFARAMAGEQG